MVPGGSLRLPTRCPLHLACGGASGENDFAEAAKTAVINKRAGGMGLISGRKAFQRPMAEGVKLPRRHFGQPHSEEMVDIRRLTGTAAAAAALLDSQVQNRRCPVWTAAARRAGEGAGV